jgi:two-component system, chemotaxis family, sensor kinase CheA
VANDIRKPLSWMLKGSNSLGYAGLDTRIEEILEALPVTDQITQADGERMVDVIVAFLDDLKTLGETTGVDLGGESLAKVLARTLKDNLLHHLTAGGRAAAETLESPATRQTKKIANLLSQRFSRITGTCLRFTPSRAATCLCCWWTPLPVPVATKWAFTAKS